MPRIPRRFQWASEACFHLMDRGHNREAIFADDEDREALLVLLGRYQSRFRLRLHHYCLMTNHFHVLVQLEDPAQVSALMAGLLRAYVHHCHRRHGFVGHRWQGRFKSPAVQCSKYLLSCGRYIARNPLEVGLVALPWAYPWSSAAAYALGKPDVLLTENAEYLGLASSAAQRQETWQRFLLADDRREAMVRRGDWAIGDEDFRQRVLLEQGLPAPRRRGRPPKPASAARRISP
jgi:putative transposase